MTQPRQGQCLPAFHPVNKLQNLSYGNDNANKVCTRMFKTTLFTVPNHCNQGKHTTKREWLNKLWYTINRTEL